MTVWSYLNGSRFRRGSDLIQDNRTYHLAFCMFEDRPKFCTWIHFVADHFSPFVVGQLPWRLVGSVVPSGCRLKQKQVCQTMSDVKYVSKAPLVEAAWNMPCRAKVLSLVLCQSLNN